MKTKMIKRGLLLILLFLSSIALFSQEKTAPLLSLRQCVETGIANNQEVLQRALQAEADGINWKQSKLDRLPVLNGFANHGINQGRSIDPFTNAYINQQINFAGYGLSSGVVLFNGLSLHNTTRQTKLTYEASKMDWQQAKDNLTLNIILAYLQVLSNEDLLVQVRNQAQLSKSQVDRLDVLNKEGAIAPSQFHDLKGQYANDQLTIITTQNALETAKLNLCQLMNIPYDSSIKLERLDAVSFASKYGNDPGQIYQVALAQFSLVKAVDLRRQSAEKAVKVARGQLYPTLSLNGNLNTNYSDAARADILLNTTDEVSNDYVLVNGSPSPVIRKQKNYRSDKITYSDQLNNNVFSTVSLNLRIPIFNSLQARNRVKLAKLELKNNELTVSTTKTQLQQAVEQAYVNLSTAWDRYKVLLEQVEAFNESFRAATIRFNSGVGNSIDYLTAKNNLDRAEANLVNARYDYLLRTKILDYYQGKPLW
jgi:outer membrane protein